MKEISEDFRKLKLFVKKLYSRGNNYITLKYVLWMNLTTN